MKQGDRFGFVDRAGAVVVAPQYEDAAPFSEGFAAVKRDGRTGFIDRAGKVAIPFRYMRAAWIATFHAPMTSKVSPFTTIAVASERPMPRNRGYF